MLIELLNVCAGAVGRIECWLTSSVRWRGTRAQPRRSPPLGRGRDTCKSRVNDLGVGRRIGVGLLHVCGPSSN
ncbi:unnamed protein product [Arctia plantaginis]|uniref:Uncharacterized protein n=1 Tax=Arctia plantaginis TaxID=874455 RepID=A0A8S1BEB2_ARCPL|nr:unnamed protein product [Arctia plantaginis]